MKQRRQYGTWPSPITPKSLAGSIDLRDIQWDSDGETLVWYENRGGRGVLVAQTGSDAPRDLTEPDVSVRARVGYGGGDFTVAGGSVYFAGPDGRLYKQVLHGGQARPITPTFGDAAAPRVSADGRWLVYVHSYERIDGLALVDSDGELWPRKLAFGTDFVMQPSWHPDSTHLAYIAWNHPQMPWDGTELRLATLEEVGGVPHIASMQSIAGNNETAIFQPEFSPDGRYLAYISDETGWGQLFVYHLTDKTHTQLTHDNAEHGKPAWIQGMRVYGWNHDSSAIYYLRNEAGVYSLWRCDISTGDTVRVPGMEDYTFFSQIAVSPKDESIAIIASASDIPTRIVSLVAQSNATPRAVSIHRRSSSENLPREQLAKAQPVSWKGHDGGTVYGLYYAPTSDRYQGTGAPPLIVHVHGGPTSQRTASYDGEMQFFASRGFAQLQVNHRGSTGYGKAFMNMLRGNWGIYDVEDSASGAAYLASQGLADRTKLVIMGGSAGGYTVLQSLVDKPGFYKAAVCLFGISNQFTLVQDTHKFEERYSDSLLGVLPEAAEIYRARSPLFHAHKITDPVIVFQGADDKVVPQSQSDSIVASLKSRGVPHEYHLYQGEGHGFRKPETLEHFYDAVMKFLTQYVIYT